MNRIVKIGMGALLLGVAAVDSSKFDCEKECQKQGATTGVCVTDDDFCADGIDSAHCECITT